MGLLDDFVDRISDLGPLTLHLAAAGLAFSETAMFLDLLVPGEVGMVLVGAAGHRAEVPLPTLVAAGAVGAVLGDSTSYLLGRLVVAVRLPGSARVVRRASTSVERAERFFGHHGGRAVFLGRFVGALRAVVPFTAGLARMPYARFLVWNVAASIAWVAVVIGAGWALGGAVAATVEDLSAGLSLMVVAGLVLVVLRRRRRRRRVERSGPPALPREPERADARD